MAKNYELGKDYYMPVTVHKDGSEDDCKFPIGIKYNDGNKEMTDYIQDEPGLLLTASEIAANFHYRKNIKRDNRLEELEAENGKLKQQLAERDELLSDAADRIKTLEEAADRSIFFEKIANQQEVIDALVEKIRRLEGGET